MTPLSVRHHEVPRWLLTHFAEGNQGMLWVGFKADRRVQPVSTRDAFVRNGVNLRIDYIPQPDGTYARVRSDEVERALARFDNVSSVAAREMMEAARRWRDSGLVASSLSRATVVTCKRLILFQARRTREAQDRIGLGDYNPVPIADMFRARADELNVTLPSTKELVRNHVFARVVKDISRNHRATFAGGQHPLDLKKEMDLLVQRGLRIAVVSPSIGEFVIGSFGLTSGRTMNGRDSWLPIAPDVAIAHSDAPGHVRIQVVSRSFLEWHNRTALRTSERVGASRKETLQDLLATSG